MASVVSVNPFRCRVWHMHHRLEDYISEETCKAEIRSFAEHGQLVPVLGRRLRSGSDHEVELIYGARRLFVARHINAPLLVELRDLSDRDAIIAMDLENRQRRDISPYERGLSYARWLQAGLFKSQEDIAHALKMSASQVSRVLRLSRLPREIIDAFHSALDIRESWGLQLAELIETPDKRARVLDAARVLASISPRPAAEDVYRHLVASAGGQHKPRRNEPDRVIRDQRGEPLFQVQFQRNSVTLVLPVQKVSALALERIKRAICSILQGRNFQRAITQSLDTPCESRL